MGFEPFETVQVRRHAKVVVRPGRPELGRGGGTFATSRGKSCVELSKITDELPVRAGEKQDRIQNTVYRRINDLRLFEKSLVVTRYYIIDGCRQKIVRESKQDSQKEMQKGSDLATRKLLYVLFLPSSCHSTVAAMHSFSENLQEFWSV